jgi:hypothetical protein
MLYERDSTIGGNELRGWGNLADLLWALSHRALLFHHQTASEVISFSPAENTAQRVIIGNIFRHPGGEMSVCCEAAGQEHDGKNKDRPARNSPLPKIPHNESMLNPTDIMSRS